MIIKYGDNTKTQILRSEKQSGLPRISQEMFTKDTKLNAILEKILQLLQGTRHINYVKNYPDDKIKGLINNKNAALVKILTEFENDITQRSK